MENRVFSPGAILLPSKDTDIKKWSVVACDQYTSEPEYWDAVSSFVGNSPSTLHLTLPEIYLESGDTSERIASINSNMNDYISSGVFSSAVSTIGFSAPTVLKTTLDPAFRWPLMILSTFTGISG